MHAWYLLLIVLLRCCTLLWGMASHSFCRKRWTSPNMLSGWRRGWCHLSSSSYRCPMGDVGGTFTLPVSWNLGLKVTRPFHGWYQNAWWLEPTFFRLVLTNCQSIIQIALFYHGSIADRSALWYAIMLLNPNRTKRVFLTNNTHIGVKL